MRIKVVDSTPEIPIEEFADSENVTLETIASWARQGKINIVEKAGRQFVKVFSISEVRNKKALFSPGLSFEIPVKLTKLH